MFKKILLTLIFLFLLLPLLSQAQINPELYFFYSDSCPHCHKEALFLDSLEKDYSTKIKINRLEIGKDSENVDFMLNMASDMGVEVSGVPFTVIGTKYFIGYYNDEVTGGQIKQTIDDLLSTSVNSVIIPSKPIGQPEPNGIDANNVVVDTEPDIILEDTKDNIMIPFIGQVDAQGFSLPLLSIVLGFLDGFNPCAMWALIFLISFLLGMKDRKRMWILGVVFIVTSAFVYFLFMAAWLNIFLFLGLVLWVRIAIGILAIGGGGYNIREFFKNKAGTCKLDGQEKKRQVFDKLKNITEQKSFLLALIGIVLLAVAVNMVELICSAGLPAVYTQVLALNDLNTWQYYSYILLYIFFFMLDDLLVFFVAMITMHLTGLSTKYSRYSSLVGGIIMLIIGLLLLFKYDILTFA
jgi:thiol-disulfide isomerase/thioredoxin